MQSRSKSEARNSKFNQIRNSTLAVVGGKVIDTMGVNINDPSFAKSQKKFFLLPSSHASRLGSNASKIGSQNSLKNQTEQLNEIIGGGSQADETRKIDSSASSYIAAKNSFFGIEQKKMIQKSRDIRTPSSIAEESLGSKRFGKSVFEIGKKTSLKPIKEEPQSFGKTKRLFLDSMMTPTDRLMQGYKYDILTCSFRKF